MTNDFTPKQAAQLLGVSTRRVQAMLKQKKKHFPGAKQYGRSWLIPACDLERYLTKIA